MSTVNEIASRKEIVTITADSGKTAYDVADLMKRNGVGSIIVIDKKIKVEEIMSSPLITIMSYDSIDTASRVMTKNKIKRLIVLEPDNRITGLLSVFDITKHLAKILLDDYNRYRSLRFAVNLS